MLRMFAWLLYRPCVCMASESPVSPGDTHRARIGDYTAIARPPSGGSRNGGRGVISPLSPLFVPSLPSLPCPSLPRSSPLKSSYSGGSSAVSFPCGPGRQTLLKNTFWVKKSLLVVIIIIIDRQFLTRRNTTKTLQRRSSTIRLTIVTLSRQQ